MEAAKGPLRFVRFQSEGSLPTRYDSRQRDPSDVDPRAPQPPAPFFPTSQNGGRAPFSLEDPSAKPPSKLGSLRKWPSFSFRSNSGSLLGENVKRVFAEELTWRKYGVFDPHGALIRQWNKLFVVACLVAAAVDPLFFFLPEVDLNNKCVQIEYSFAVTVTVLRSVTDLVYLVQMLLQFRVAFVERSSRIFGRGELVVDKMSIARHYLRGNFVLDFIAWLPIPQFVLWVFIPLVKQRGAASTSKDWLRSVVILQYIPRIIRMIPIQTSLRRPGTLAFETASSGFVINLLIFLLASHVIGAAWYLLGVERVDHCWRRVCKNETASLGCTTAFFDCTSITNPSLQTTRQKWATNTLIVTQCVNNSMQPGGYFDYGIYGEILTIIAKLGVQRYFFSLWWGLQNLTSMGQPLQPSTFAGELFFCIVIALVGMLLLAMLVGNMQKYLQSLGRRVEEHRTTLRDTEAWMKHRQLPPDLRKKVRQFDRLKWSAMHGVDEEKLLSQLPEDLQRDIKRHLCQGLVKKVPLFEKMEPLVLDAICERLKPQLFIRGSCIIREGDPVFRMLFIIRGQMQSTESAHGRSDALVDTVTLTSGDFVGDELMSWCLDPRPKQYYPSSVRTVFVDSPVEAFSLNADDLRYVAGHYLKHGHRMELRRALRNYSPHWKIWGALAIQAAWRRYKRKKDGRRLIQSGHSVGSSAAVYEHMFLDNARKVAAARKKAEASDRFDGSAATVGAVRARASTSNVDVSSLDADVGGSSTIGRLPSVRQRRRPATLKTDGQEQDSVSAKLKRVPTPTGQLAEGFWDESPELASSSRRGRQTGEAPLLQRSATTARRFGLDAASRSTDEDLRESDRAASPFDPFNRVRSIGRALVDRNDSQTVEEFPLPRGSPGVYGRMPTIGRALE